MNSPVHVMTDFPTIRMLFGITEPIGFPDEQIQSAIHENGTLPQVLLDYYATLGAHEGLNRSQDYLVEPQQLQGWATDDFIVFWHENQNVTQWGIRREDLTLPNPPVYANCDDNGWEKEKDHLTDFFDMMAHFQALFGLPYRNEAFVQLTQEQAETVRKQFRRKDAQLPAWYGVEFYGNQADSVISLIKSGDGFGLMYASNNEAHFDTMQGVLDAEYGSQQEVLS